MRHIVPALLASALVFSGCRPEKPAEEAADAPKVVDGKIVFPSQSTQLGALGVAPAEAGQGVALRLNGRLVWDDNVTVRVFTSFAGRVTKILVEPGQPVKKGDTLALVASADYGQAQAEARKASGDFALAERTLARVKDLLEHGAAPQKDMDQAEADLGRARSELQRSTSRLAFYGGDTGTVDQVYELKSPLDGVVVEKNLNPGQEVRPDQMLAGTDKLAAPLFTITDPSRLWIQLDAGETDLGQLRVGQEFEVRSRAFPDQASKGRVDAVSDFLDPATRTIKVRGSVDNARRHLRAEMFVTVLLAAEGAATGAQVPAKAVYLRGEKHFLFTEEAPGQFTRREVKAGPEHEGKVPVFEGIQPGQRVVIDGSLLLEQLLQTPEGS